MGNFLVRWKYRHFVGLLEKKLKERGLEPIFDYENAMVWFKENDGVMMYGNILKTCAMLPENQWENIIESFVNDCFSSIRQIERAQKLLSSYAYVKRKIFPRIHSAQENENDEYKGTLHREDIPGLLTVLYVREDRFNFGLSKDIVQKWNVHEDNIFAHAIKNLKRQGRLRFQKLELKDGKKVYLSESAIGYNSSHVLILETYAKYFGNYGVFYSLPVRDSLLLFPCSSADDIDNLWQFQFFTLKLYEAFPYPITQAIYWFYNGVHKKIQCLLEKAPEKSRNQEDVYVFLLPKELKELMNLHEE